MTTATQAYGADLLDFAPDILRLQREPPSPLPRLVLYVMVALLIALLIWSLMGRLDIIAVAPGKLVPVTYVKVVQPATAGIIKELLVRDGDLVKAGQVLVRLDPGLFEADGKQSATQLQLTSLALRRIDAELANEEPQQQPGDSAELFTQMLSQYRAHRQAQLDAVDAQKAVLAKTEQDLKAALEMEAKLKQTLPIYEDQERSWSQLYKEGFAGRLLAEDRKRALIEARQELKAQSFAIEGYRATIQQSRKRIAQLDSNYRQMLYNERADTFALNQKAEQDRQKLSIRQEFLELKAPQDGVVKDLATHTEGAVLSPGTVLMTIVPASEPVSAEVWVSNLDRGFVHAGQTVKLKIAPYPFQKYGMVEGIVVTISADASEPPATDSAKDRKEAAPRDTASAA